jgi:hypothetical protein
MIDADAELMAPDEGVSESKANCREGIGKLWPVRPEDRALDHQIEIARHQDGPTRLANPLADFPRTAYLYL